MVDFLSKAEDRFCLCNHDLIDVIKIGVLWHLTQTLHKCKLGSTAQGLGIEYTGSNLIPPLNVMRIREECHVPCIPVNSHVFNLQICKSVVFFILFGKLPSFFFILVFGEVCTRDVCYY